MQANRNSQTTSTKCQYQAAASKPKCCCGVKAPLSARIEADSQEDRADDHVRAVEARRHEECRAVAVAGEAESGVAVFDGLEDRERHAEQDCQHETDDEAAAIVLQKRMVRPRYRAARGQQNERVDAAVVPKDRTCA